MARFKYGGIITKISGSIGGATFQRSSFGNTLRSKPLPIHSRNINQLERRAYMHQLQHDWNDLTDDDRKKWKQFIAYSSQSIIADSNVLISGYNLFLKYQFCRLMYGLPILVDFTYIPIPAWPKSFIVYADQNQIYAQFITTLDPTEYFFILLLSNPRNPSNAYSPVNGRFMFCDLAGSNIFVFTNSYVSNFGLLPNNGDTLHFSIYYFSLKAPLLSGFQTGKLIVGATTPTQWTDVSSTSLDQYCAIAYGDGLYIALTFHQNGTNYATSPDGINWTYRASGIPGLMTGIVYNGSYWLLITSNDNTHPVYTSPDGINWTGVDGTNNLQWWCCASDGTAALALTNASGHSYFGASWVVDDWSAYDIAPFTAFSQIAAGNGIFVALQIAPYKTMVINPAGGHNWSFSSTDSVRQWEAITFGNGIFVAATASEFGSNFGISTDGINWTLSSNAPYGQIYGLAYGNGRFVAVGISNVGNYFLSSTDGLNWILEETPNAYNYRAICSNGSQFVALSSDQVSILVSS